MDSISDQRTQSSEIKSSSKLSLYVLIPVCPVSQNYMTASLLYDNCKTDNIILFNPPVKSLHAL